MTKMHLMNDSCSEACRREFIRGPRRPVWILPLINSLRHPLRFKAIFAGMFCLVALCPQASAATKTATAQDSTIMFRIKHDLGYTVGYFGDFTATLDLGDAPGQITSTKMQVATASINTRNNLRDEGLRSAMFFDAAQFPQATFESAKVEGDEITGTMTIKGVSQPVVLKVQKDAPSGKLVLKGEFNRNDFGVTYNITRADKKKSIGDVVELIIELKV